MTSMPSATELTYFCEIAKTLNVSQASKNLSISQPSLTRAIQQLEAKLGVILFIRHKKGVTLTPAGKNFLLKVKPLLQYWQEAHVHVRAAHEDVQGHIRIGCHSIIGLFIHGFLTELLEKYSQLELEIFNNTSDVITQKVIDLELDIGIVSYPMAYPDLIVQKISCTDTTLWVGNDKGKIQDPYSDACILICNPQFWHTQFMLQQLKKKKITFSRLLKVTDIEVIASLTANNCGVGILPASFVQGLYAGQLKRVPNMPVLTEDLFLVYRKEYKNIQAIKTIVATIKKWAAMYS